MYQTELNEINTLVGNSLNIDDVNTITVADAAELQKNIGKLVEKAIFGEGKMKGLARFVIRAAALDLDIVPASIHDLYTARGAGKVPNTFTVPAMNLRALSFISARAVFRAAMERNAAAILFEIARSEIGYTDQRPSEYSANILGAAIAEGYRGPVFIQGDHFQISASRYTDNPEAEVNTVKELIQEAIQAGFYNIDVDTSTLVDLSHDDVTAQQELNVRLSAEISAHIRSLEPQGITVSIGGEIGEVGGRNSTEEELRAYTEGYNAKLKEIAPDAIGLSKISIQTGTSHGGVVLPDGSIAQVSVDFDTLLQLSKAAREYGMGGAVQHGASTLPQDAFGKFVESEAIEVHLATNFQNIFFDEMDDALRDKIYTYLDENHNNERKDDQTDEQFYYKTRKQGIGRYKAESWTQPQAALDNIAAAWEAQFSQLFDALAIADTRNYVNETIKPVKVMPDLEYYITSAGGDSQQEDVSDLAD